MECKILLIDNPADTILLKEFIHQVILPVNLQCTHSIAEALEIITVSPPDMILVGSCILLVEGLQLLNELSKVPIVVLAEMDGFDRLLKEKSGRIYFITKPIDLDKIPGVIEEAYQFWTTFREVNI